MSAACPMMFVEMKAPEALTPSSRTMEEVLVNQPLPCICVQQADGKPDHHPLLKKLTMLSFL
jgi:hypothetical protein